MDEKRSLSLQDWMPYSRSKALAEAYVLKAVKEGLDAVILNPTAVIGPYDYVPSLLGQTIIRLCSGKLPFLVRGGYDWVDVRDVARAAQTAVEKARTGERYILSGSWRSLSDLTRIISSCSGSKPCRRTCPLWLARAALPFTGIYCRALKKNPLYTRDSLLTLQTGHKDISSAKAEKELEFKKRPLEATIRDTVNWFRSSGLLSC
jgi:dihydroflavonol-4-reductase